MKTFLLLAALLPLSVGAQTITRFQAEGKDYYEALGCKPGTPASFYSSVHGGRLLAAYPAAADGKARAAATKDFQPQMLLNEGQASYIGAREFSIATPQVVAANGAALIKWDASAADADDISFRLLRSRDGRGWEPVPAVTETSVGDAMQQFNVTDSWVGNATLYKVAVESKKWGLRYTTQAVLLAAATTITVFPTLVSDVIYISVPPPDAQAAYCIISSDGKKVAGGPLTSARSSIRMDKLPAGNYIVSVGSGADTRSVKVVKQ